MFEDCTRNVAGSATSSSVVLVVPQTSPDLHLVSRQCGQELSAWTRVSLDPETSSHTSLRVTSLAPYTCYQFSIVHCSHQSQPSQQIHTLPDGEEEIVNFWNIHFTVKIFMTKCIFQGCQAQLPSLPLSDSFLGWTLTSLLRNQVFQMVKCKYDFDLHSSCLNYILLSLNKMNIVNNSMKLLWI